MAKKKIDFGGVDPEIRKGGGGSHVPEGDYLFKIVKGEFRTSEKTGGTYINWQLQVASGPSKGRTVYTNTSLKPDALWALRNLIHAATGKNVAGKALNFDPDMVVGKVVAATATDREYNNKMTSDIDDIRPKEEVEESEEDEDEGEEAEEEEEEEELEDVDLEDL